MYAIMHAELDMFKTPTHNRRKEVSKRTYGDPAKTTQAWGVRQAPEEADDAG
jgi:hypothetical protein